MALTAEEFDGKTVKSLKTLVAKQIGVSRFRQRWLSENHTELQDDEFVTASDVQLVVLPFVQPADETVGEADKELYVASLVNDADWVEKLLRKPVSPDTIDYDRSQWKTAMHIAAECGHAECIALLLEAGADKDLADFEGTTALDLAAQNGDVEIVRLLLGGADKEVAASNLQKALRLAAWGGHSDVVKLLLEEGADKDAAEKDGQTALHVAAGENNLEVVMSLLEAGADKDVVNCDGMTPLHLAAVNGNPDAVELLLKAGSNKDVVDALGQTALHLAARNGFNDIVHMLEAPSGSKGFSATAESLMMLGVCSYR